MQEVHEYKVRPVTRYIITEWYQSDTVGGCGPIGEFDNEESALRILKTLEAAEAMYQAGTMQRPPKPVYDLSGIAIPAAAAVVGAQGD